MILSGGEQRDSALHIHVSILPWFILKMLFMMSKNSTQIFIKYTAVCWVMTPTPPKKKKKRCLYPNLWDCEYIAFQGKRDSADII